MCTSKSELDRWVILECVDIKIILGNLSYKLFISVGYWSINRARRRIELKFELFALINPKKVVFSYNLISIGHCSTNNISRQVEYGFEFSAPENLKVSTLWSEDRARIVSQLDRGQRRNPFPFNYLCNRWVSLLVTLCFIYHFVAREILYRKVYNSWGFI